MIHMTRISDGAPAVVGTELEAEMLGVQGYRRAEAPAQPDATEPEPAQQVPPSAAGPAATAPVAQPQPDAAAVEQPATEPATALRRRS